jgi:hypothetical protein
MEDPVEDLLKIRDIRNHSSHCVELVAKTDSLVNSFFYILGSLLNSVQFLIIFYSTLTITITKDLFPTFYTTYIGINSLHHIRL